jgi:hypothetical protein
MPKERILITVKTYPTLSQSYVELVCTAGLREDGSWVRIYPVPFRLLDTEKQFAKWTWVELPLVRRATDHRHESFSPLDRNDIIVGETIGTNDGWRERKRWVQKRGPIWTDLTALIAVGKRDEVSLGTFRPTELISFEWQKSAGDWDAKKLAAAQLELQQLDFLDASDLRENFKPANKLPYDFYYKFADEKGRESRLRILDWEIGMLYWNCLKSAHGDEAVALEKVRQKYQDDFFSKDLHFFLGTTYEWHKRADNPWVIIGVLPLPHQLQQELF